MATIKSYTDISQSKTLSKILPLESADMWWLYITSQGKHIAMMYEEPDPHYLARMESYGIKNAAIRCWSLAALLAILPFPVLYMEMLGGMILWSCECHFMETNEVVKMEHYNNPIDACYEMIIRLNELNLL